MQQCLLTFLHNRLGLRGVASNCGSSVVHTNALSVHLAFSIMCVDSTLSQASQPTTQTCCHTVLCVRLPLPIPTGDLAVLGSCPEAKLLQHAFQACPYTAGWETCDTSLCEFSTPSFIPSRVQPLGLGNTTATVPTINEAAQQPNSTTELPFFDTYPGPICFPDVARTSMVLHGLLGVSAELAKELEKLQARCVETEDVVFDVARGVAACGLEMFSYDSDSLYKAVGMQPPVVLPVAQGAQAAPATQSPAQQQASAGPAVQKQPGAAASPAAAVPALAAAATAPAAAAAAGAGSSSAKAISGSSSSSSNGSGGSSVMGQQQRPKVATEIGYRSHARQ